MKFKGFHYDRARGAYLRPEYFKQALQHAAKAGFTHFLPYLENMILLPSMAKACPESAYTPEQWQDFDQTAKICGIELVPHFNVIGHANAICAAYPELQGGTKEHEMDITLPETKNFVLNCLREFCSFSSSKYFLIGGDEYQFPSHLLRNPNFEPARAFAEHINMVAEELVGSGRIPLMWHDMLIHYPETLELLSRNVVVVFWFYDEDSDYPLLDMLQQRGFKTIMAGGLCGGLLTRRRLRAAKLEIEAVEKYKSHGFMMTTWSDGRFEKQRLNIKFTGKLLAGERIPDKFLEANSLRDILAANPAGEAVFIKKVKDRLLSLLGDELWKSSPEYQEYYTAVFSDNRDKVIESYLKYHFPEGPLFNMLNSVKNISIQISAPIKYEYDNDKFEVLVSQAFGTPELKILNGDESFLIYPEYGASIQAYRKCGIELISHSVPKAKPLAPGGYRSYSSALGFCPIWAFGSQHNPCILWQGPFKWNIMESADLLKIELSRDMYHVSVKYLITVKKGIAGFTLEVEACNKIDDIYGTFNFNLPLTLTPGDISATTLEWEGKCISPVDVGDTFFVIPATGELVVRRPRISLAIAADKNKTSGFYADWRTVFITPDLRGKYQKLKAGEFYRTAWSFKPSIA